MENDKFLKWREKFIVRQQKENRKRKMFLLLSIISIPIWIYLFKLVYTGDYKFIGEHTQIIKARIYKTDKLLLTRATSTQVIYYEYTIDDNLYSDYTHSGHDLNSRFEKYIVNDCVVLKISKENPEKHVVVGFEK